MFESFTVAGVGTKQSVSITFVVSIWVLTPMVQPDFHGSGDEGSILDDPGCRTPTLTKCGGEAQHLEKSGVGVLRDSRMFRAQQQGPKHLALRCS
jgi:hypothetical protein